MKLVEEAELRGNRSGESVVIQEQILELAQAAGLGGNRAGEGSFIQEQSVGKLGEGSNLSGDRAGETMAAHSHFFSIVEEPDLSGDGAGKTDVFFLKRQPQIADAAPEHGISGRTRRKARHPTPCYRVARAAAHVPVVVARVQ